MGQPFCRIIYMDKYVLSLFSSAGIGELGIKASGLKILLSNELLKNRCSLYEENYPETKSICGDIWELQDEICQNWQAFEVGNPFLIYATPPCQGMSFNSVGKRLHEIRKGIRPKDDPRNRLIIPTIELVKKLKPQWILLENVQGMQNTLIEVEDGVYKNIIDYIKEELFPDYVGGPEVVNCADYGIPQTRVRLIASSVVPPSQAGQTLVKMCKYQKKAGEQSINCFPAFCYKNKLSFIIKPLLLTLKSRGVKGGKF